MSLRSMNIALGFLQQMLRKDLIGQAVAVVVVVVVVVAVMASLASFVPPLPLVARVLLHVPPRVRFCTMYLPT